MSIYNYEYKMELKLNAKCVEHAFSLMCFPQDNERQKIMFNNVSVNPKCSIAYSNDWAGNKKGSGLIADSHDTFCVEVKGSVETYASFYEEYDNNPSKFYRYPTSLTNVGEEIKELAKKIKADNIYESSIEIMHLVHESLEYCKGVTNIYSTAIEAYKLKKGVCQDYAHLMIALCRYKGYPCRYVAGLVAGEGASHAWVEVNCNGYWYGFDPTWDKIVGDSYVKFSHGRDSSDCAINRGSFKGCANQEQTIFASMKKGE